jgi:hypothetical protein
VPHKSGFEFGLDSHVSSSRLRFLKTEGKRFWEVFWGHVEDGSELVGCNRTLERLSAEHVGKAELMIARHQLWKVAIFHQTADVSTGELETSQSLAAEFSR